MKKNKLGLVALSLCISGFFGGILFAAINYSEYLPNSSSLYQSQTNGWASPTSGSSKEIMTPEGCKKITSTMSGRLFIPTKSMAEWTTFKNSAIAGITIAECPVNGTCGSAHGISTPIYPTANWCTTGTKADVDTTGSDGIYNWNCNGLYGGTGASCSANKIFYTVSGSFGTNGSGASITGCGGKTATASSTGMFLFTGVSNGTNCNNITATRTNYTCTTSTNGPASITTNVTNVAGSCVLPVSCTNNIKDTGELGTDCGGICPACKFSYTQNTTGAAANNTIKFIDLGVHNNCVISKVWGDVTDHTSYYLYGSTGSTWTIAILDEGNASTAYAETICNDLSIGGSSSTEGSPCGTGNSGIMIGGCCYEGTFVKYNPQSPWLAWYPDVNWNVSNSCGIAWCSDVTVGSCGITKSPASWPVYCDNGFQDNGETGVDCGGSCKACGGGLGSCNNGIQDNDETGIDCGGSCTACWVPGG